MSFWTKFKEFFTLEPLEPSGERTRDGEGRYVADDKSTKNVNEAYKDGKTPKRGRGRPKGSKNKKR